jgi:hypothetical protein
MNSFASRSVHVAMSNPNKLLPSPGVIRLQRYYEPRRHPMRPGPSLAGVRLAIPDRAMGVVPKSTGRPDEAPADRSHGATADRPSGRLGEPQARLLPPPARAGLSFQPPARLLAPFLPTRHRGPCPTPTSSRPLPPMMSPTLSRSPCAIRAASASTTPTRSRRISSRSG